MDSRLKYNGIKVFILLFLGISLSQTCKLNAQERHDTLTVWHNLQKGLCFWEPDAPEKSMINDSKIFILKADPRLCNFRMLSSSEHGKQNRPADVWAKDFGVSVAVNAGMFNIRNHRTNKGYLKNYSHTNNSKLNGSYNVVMAMNPKRKSDPAMTICDLTCTNWEAIKSNYHTLCQGMRMIDCDGNRMAWDKRPGQACSMVVGATDLTGNIYFIFTRSPYTHQKMIGFLIRLIPDIRTTVYLEGGPEASLYIQTNDTIISKYGSYVSKTYANDNNDHFWKIPNVIGIQSR
jgi:hypothetical protein